jgi:hypothetical protein
MLPEIRHQGTSPRLPKIFMGIIKNQQFTEPVNKKWQAG